MARSHSNPEPDNFDLKIIRQLAGDGRISWRDLADGIGLTPTLRRVRRLETAGYIRGYSADLHEKRLSGGMNVFVSVTLLRQSDDMLRPFEEKIAKHLEVVSGFRMTGGSDYLLRVVV